MKKRQKVIQKILIIFGLLVGNVTPLKAATVSYSDFHSVSNKEILVGHSLIGAWNNGTFFETITCEKVGINKETMKGTWRFRYYITHKGAPTSYTFQIAAVGVFLDGVMKQLFPHNATRVSNTSMLINEAVIEISEGVHNVSLRDVEAGGITQVSVAKDIGFSLDRYLVKFIDWDNTVLKAQTVIEGNDATPPADPSRKNSKFMGWLGAYRNVQSNRDIYATYDQFPTIDANDIVILTNTFIPATWKKYLLTCVSVNDAEDKDIKKHVQIIYDDTQLDKVGVYKVIFQVQDSANSIAQKSIKVTILDGTHPSEKSQKRIRSISWKHFETLSPQSLWRKDKEMNTRLITTLKNNGAKKIASWHLTKSDIQAMQAFIRSHPRSKATNQAFKKQFQHLRNTE